jgi:hypothetical protein
VVRTGLSARRVTGAVMLALMLALPSAATPERLRPWSELNCFQLQHRGFLIGCNHVPTG